MKWTVSFLCIGKARKEIEVSLRIDVEDALKSLKGVITAVRGGVRFGRFQVIFTTPEVATECAT